MLIPYTAPEVSVAFQERTLFNERFSKARVIIEHVMGILKNQWQSLRGIRKLIVEREDFERVFSTTH